jgi:hypothetical protein
VKGFTLRPPAGAIRHAAPRAPADETAIGLLVAAVLAVHAARNKEAPMLELILILAVVVYLVSKLDARHFEQARSEQGLDPREAGPARPAPQPRPTMRLQIEGTQRPVLRSTGFVKGFGVNPLTLQDLRVYTRFGKLEQFPETIAAMLRDLYDRGTAVGIDMMELLFHGRCLREGEAVYFALVDAAPEPRVVAFVDKLRRH